MTIRSWFARPAKGNVSVEFALITAFFVLPLLMGASDFVVIISAQAQLNTALQALYDYGVTNPASATNASSSDAGNIITLIDQNSDFYITPLASLPTAQQPNLTYACYTTSTTASTVPTITANANSGCGSGKTTLTYANYTVTTSVTLPLPLPGLHDPLSLSAAGYVQISSVND